MRSKKSRVAVFGVIFVLLLALIILATFRFPKVESSLAGLSVIEVSIRDEAHQLASRGHAPLSYRELWEALRLIDGEDGLVRLIYSRELREHDKNGGRRGDWNREHSWPKSYGIGKSGADYTDLHAIFACDVSKNSSRGNKFFDSRTDRDSWLPPAEVRGDIAR